MGDRLTSRWTETADEAFGPTGTKGREGEEFLAKVFESWGWEYETYPNDRKKQLDGIDIAFKKPGWASFYTGDVKNNMDKYGNFFVHKDWLFKVKCHRIFHVNPDTQWIVWYGVDHMRAAYDNAVDYMRFTTKNRFPFMTATKAELNNDTVDLTNNDFEGTENYLGDVPEGRDS